MFSAWSRLPLETQVAIGKYLTDVRRACIPILNIDVYLSQFEDVLSVYGIEVRNGAPNSLRAWFYDKRETISARANYGVYFRADGGKGLLWTAHPVLGPAWYDLMDLERSHAGARRRGELWSSGMEALPTSGGREVLRLLRNDAIGERERLTKQIAAHQQKIIQLLPAPLRGYAGGSFTDEVA